MNGFDKLRVKSAVKSHNKFDLSRTHLTTMDFGQIVPLFVEETVPGDKFTINATYFSRMAPLVRPTYGKFSFKTMASFVPYYQICDDIDGYMAGLKQWEGATTSSRYIQGWVIVNLFLKFADDVTSLVNASGETTYYDFSYIDSSGNRKYRRYNTVGKFYAKVMNSLGYSFPEHCDLQASSTWSASENSRNYSALPLLAFLKAYNDWMAQSQRFNFSPLTSFLKNVRHDVTHVVAGTNYYNGTNHQLTVDGIWEALKQVKLCYENDYFTTAWQNANSPVGASSTYDGFSTSDGAAGAIGNTVDNNYLNQALNSNNTTNINQRGLDFLKSFDDWVRRNNYSGSRAVQQVFSRFGIKTEDYKSNYAHLIDTDTIPVQVGDVTALAQDYVGANDSKNIDLGDYAGKGIMSGENGFSFKANDYGMLFIFGYYTVAPMNVYGYDKHVLRSSAKDYYNPEFDGLGAEAISTGEVFVNPRIAGNGTSDVLDSAVFGYTERYNSYRFAKDKITGDFRAFTNIYNSTGSSDTIGTDMNCWHTGRMLTDLRAGANLVAQNANFVTMPQSDSEYNRMFSVTNTESPSPDHFYMTAQFRVTAIRPMLSLNQVPRLGVGDTVVPKNGNEVN